MREVINKGEMETEEIDRFKREGKEKNIRHSIDREMEGAEKVKKGIVEGMRKE